MDVGADLGQISAAFRAASVREAEAHEGLRAARAELLEAFRRVGLTEGEARGYLHALAELDLSHDPQRFATYRKTVQLLGPRQRTLVDRALVEQQRFEAAAGEAYRHLVTLAARDEDALVRALDDVDRAVELRLGVFEAARRMNPAVRIETVRGVLGEDHEQGGLPEGFDPLRRLVRVAMDAPDAPDRIYASVWRSIEEILDPDELAAVRASYDTPEAAAEAFAAWVQGEDRPADAGPFRRVRSFLGRVANAARGVGFVTAEDIFRQAEQGMFARRAELMHGRNPVAAVRMPNPKREPQRYERWQRALRSASREDLALAREATKRALDGHNRRLRSLGCVLTAPFRRGQWARLSENRAALKRGLRAVEQALEAAQSRDQAQAAAHDPALMAEAQRVVERYAAAREKVEARTAAGASAEEVAEAVAERDDAARQLAVNTVAWSQAVGTWSPTSVEAHVTLAEEHEHAAEGVDGEAERRREAAALRERQREPGPEPDPEETPEWARSPEFDRLRAELLETAARVNPNVELRFARRVRMAGQAVVDSGAPDASERDVAAMFVPGPMAGSGTIVPALGSARFDARASVAHELCHSLEDLLTPRERKALERLFPGDDHVTHKEKVAYAFQVYAVLKDGHSVHEVPWQVFDELEARLGRPVQKAIIGRPPEEALRAFAEVLTEDLAARESQVRLAARGLDAMRDVLPPARVRRAAHEAVREGMAIFDAMHEGIIGRRAREERPEALRRLAARASLGPDRAGRDDPAPGDHVIRDYDGEIASGGLRTKFERNLAAIELLRALEEEDRPATAQEQEVLARYVGWGAMPGAFNPWGDRGTFTKEDYNRLRQVLSDEEFEAARRSTLNAHFTAGWVVQSMYEGLERMGFEGGRVLEPAAGIGNFIGLMPERMRSGSHITAVELDSLSARILQKLYPNAAVMHTGYERVQIPDGFFDLAISNVPFGDYKVMDRRYNGAPSIHNYFARRMVDHVRPGGVAMFITSAWTMDSQDSRQREALRDAAELLGAVRLPDRTFRQNAGTEVVTDILVLRRRETPLTQLPEEERQRIIDAEPNWVELRPVEDAAGGEPIPVNRYFAERPEQVLGRIERTGTMYGGQAMNVTWDGPEEELRAALRERMAALPANVIETSQELEAEGPKTALAPAPGHVKEGAYYIAEDGALYRRVNGMPVAAELGERETEMVKAAIEVRDAVRHVFRVQQLGEPAETREEARAALNRSYDAFVERFGHFRSREVARVLATDPDHPLLASLEEGTEEKGVYVKAPVFERDTVAPLERHDRAETVEQALAISLNETGRVNLVRMRDLLGLEGTDQVVELARGLIYESPETGGWETADEYLSGNVRRKLAIAREAAAADPRFAPNVAALEAAQPEPIPYYDIDAKLGSPWIPADDVRDWMAESLGIGEDDISVAYNAATGRWAVSAETPAVRRSVAATREWGTPRMSMVDLVEKVLNNGAIVVRDRVDEHKTVVNQEETAAAQAKANELKEAFADWVWADPERRDRLERIYNETFNSYRAPSFDGSHLTFPGMSPEWLQRVRPQQRNAVWRNIVEGRALVGHEVGAGKTLTLAATVMEHRRLGLARKPMVAVKKANLEQIAREFRDIYPSANILVLPNDADEATRNRVMAQAATGEWDCVLVSHDAFDRLPMRPEWEAQFLRREAEEYRQALEELKSEDSKANNRVVKQIEKQIAKLESRVGNLLQDKRRDDVVYFEDLGVDLLCVDEAHRYKNLYIATSAQNLKGVPTAESKRAAHLYMVSEYLREVTGERGVVLATGTPVANTIAEVFNLQRYLQPAELERTGLKSFDAWLGTFGHIAQRMELTVTGDIKMTSRLSRFVNVPELKAMTARTFDIVFADEIEGLERPEPVYATISVPASPEQKAYMGELSQRAERISGWRPEAGEDNMLKISSDGRKAALDMRLVDPTAGDHPNSKINDCVARTAHIYATNPGKTQMIFLDSGLHGTTADDSALAGMTAEEAANDGVKWSVREDLKRKLVERGIPEEMILDYVDNLSDEQRAEYDRRMRRGEAAVAIGSTEKLGTGVNAQDRLCAIHNLDAPWVPAWLEQRNGRGLRQGNQNARIYLYNYVTEGTFDAFMWQTLDTKTNFIRQFLRPDGIVGREMREEEVSELSPAQVMAIASGNPLLLLRAELEHDVTSLERQAKRVERDSREARLTVERCDEELAGLRAELAAAQEAAAAAQQVRESDFILRMPEGAYTERPEAAQALVGRIESLIANMGWQRVSETLAHLGPDGRLAIEMEAKPSIRGRDVSLYVAYRAEDPDRPPVRLEVAYNPDSPNGTMSSLMNRVDRLMARPAVVERRIEEVSANRQAAERLIDRPFPKADELEQKRAQLKRVTRILDLPEPNLDQARELAEQHPDITFEAAEAEVQSRLDRAEILAAEIAELEKQVQQGGEDAGVTAALVDANAERERLRREAAAWQWVANHRDPDYLRQLEEREKPVPLPTPETLTRGAANDDRAQEAAPATASHAAERVVGMNPHGEAVHEDERGVRYVRQNGLRISEPVEMAPDGGMAINPAAREARFKTAEELEAEAGRDGVDGARAAEVGANAFAEASAAAFQAQEREQAAADALDAVERAGLAVEPGQYRGREVYFVRGNTRAHKDLLKELGGRWQRTAGAWRFQEDPAPALAARLAGAERDDVTPAEAEAINEQGHVRGQRVAVKTRDGDVKYLGTIAGPGRAGGVLVQPEGMAPGHYLSEVAELVEPLAPEQAEQTQPEPQPQVHKSWDEAQPGDVVAEDGTTLVQKGLRSRREAQALAEAEGGRVVLDGARRFAVVRDPAALAEASPQEIADATGLRSSAVVLADGRGPFQVDARRHGDTVEVTLTPFEGLDDEPVALTLDGEGRPVDTAGVEALSVHPSSAREWAALSGEERAAAIRGLADDVAHGRRLAETVRGMLREGETLFVTTDGDHLGGGPYRLQQVHVAWTGQVWLAEQDYALARDGIAEGKGHGSVTIADVADGVIRLAPDGRGQMRVIGRSTAEALLALDGGERQQATHRLAMGETVSLAGEAHAALPAEGIALTPGDVVQERGRTGREALRWRIKRIDAEGAVLGDPMEFIDPGRADPDYEQRAELARLVPASDEKSLTAQAEALQAKEEAAHEAMTAYRARLEEAGYEVRETRGGTPDPLRGERPIQRLDVPIPELGTVAVYHWDGHLYVEAPEDKAGAIEAEDRIRALLSEPAEADKAQEQTQETTAEAERDAAGGAGEGAAVEPDLRIPPVRIELGTRVNEGGHEPVVLEAAPGEGGLYGRAQAVLDEWALSAPDTGAYDKTSAIVTFADGQTYAGRIDLQHPSLPEAVDSNNLSEYLRRAADVYSGRLAPPWLEPGTAARLMAEPDQDYIALRRDYALSDAEVGRPRGLDTIEPSRVEALMVRAEHQPETLSREDVVELVHWRALATRQIGEVTLQPREGPPLPYFEASAHHMRLDPSRQTIRVRIGANIANEGRWVPLTERSLDMLAQHLGLPAPSSLAAENAQQVGQAPGALMLPEDPDRRWLAAVDAVRERGLGNAIPALAVAGMDAEELQATVARLKEVGVVDAQGEPRPLRRDGSLVPRPGDKVTCPTSGFGGTDAVLLGEVVTGRRGQEPRVRITATSSLLGGVEPARRKRTVALDERWRVQGDPVTVRERIAREEQAAAQAAAVAEEQQQAVTAAQERAGEALGAGSRAVTADSLQPGVVLEAHRADGTDRLVLVEEIDGVWYAADLDAPLDGPRSVDPLAQDYGVACTLPHDQPDPAAIAERLAAGDRERNDVAYALAAGAAVPALVDMQGRLMAETAERGFLEVRGWDPLDGDVLAQWDRWQRERDSEAAQVLASDLYPGAIIAMDGDDYVITEIQAGREGAVFGRPVDALQGEDMVLAEGVADILEDSEGRYSIDRDLNTALLDRAGALAERDPAEWSAPERAFVLGQSRLDGARLQGRDEEAVQAALRAEAEIERSGAETDARQAGDDGRDAGDDPIAAAGLTVTRTTTGRGREVWEVRGNTREHKDLLRGLGGRWYRPARAWSFREDPTAMLADALARQQQGEQAAETQRPETQGHEAAAQAAPEADAAAAESGATAPEVTPLPPRIYAEMADGRLASVAVTHPVEVLVLDGEGALTAHTITDPDAPESVAARADAVVRALGGTPEPQPAGPPAELAEPARVLLRPGQDGYEILANTDADIMLVERGTGAAPHWAKARALEPRAFDMAALEAGARAVSTREGGRPGLEGPEETFEPGREDDNGLPGPLRALHERLSAIADRLEVIEQRTDPQRLRREMTRAAKTAIRFHEQDKQEELMAQTQGDTQQRVFLNLNLKEVGQEERDQIKEAYGLRWQRVPGADGRRKAWSIDPEHPRFKEAVERFGTLDQAQQKDQQQGQEQDGRTYLYVTKPEKDQAKELGARWDRQAGMWYAPPGSDLSAFQRWRTPEARQAWENQNVQLEARRERQGEVALVETAEREAASQRPAAERPPQEREATHEHEERGPPHGEQRVPLPGLDVRQMDPATKDAVKETYGLKWDRDNKVWTMPADHPKAKAALEAWGQAPEKEATAERGQDLADTAARYSVSEISKKPGHYRVTEHDGERDRVVGFLNPGKRGKGHFLQPYAKEGQSPLEDLKAARLDPSKPLDEQIEAARQQTRERPARAAEAERGRGERAAVGQDRAPASQEKGEEKGPDPLRLNPHYRDDTKDRIRQEVAGLSNEDLAARMQATQQALAEAEKAGDQRWIDTYKGGLELGRQELKQRGLEDPTRAKGREAGHGIGD